MSGPSIGSGELPGIAGDPRSTVHRLAPRTKVLGLVGVTLVAVSAGPSLWPVWLACLAALGGVALAARVPAGVIVRRSRVVLPLVVLAAAALPLVRDGGARIELGPIVLWEEGLLAMAAVAAKATIGTLSAVLLGATTSFPQTLRALEGLRVPRLFLVIAATMHRYLPVAMGEVRRTHTALLARGWRRRSALGAAPVGRVAGTLFLRAQARGERVHRAMLARAYAGTLPAPPLARAARADLAFALAVPGALVAVRALAELS
jgi:cobalt/nickel transport system permease protein